MQLNKLHATVKERNEAKEALVHVIVKEQAYIIEQFDEYSAVAKAYILEELAKDNMIKMRPILIKTLGIHLKNA